jgi:type I restriction enzyme R subunit
MEHAIRKHCKVKYEQDPAFYRNLLDKLEELIKQQKDNWDELYKYMFQLRQEAEQGRKASVSGVSMKAEPFHDVIIQSAFGKQGVPDTQAEQVKTLANLVIKKLQDTIYMTNFWRPNNPDVEQLQGGLSDLILLTGIDEIVDKSDKLVADITQLAKVRHNDIVEP